LELECLYANILEADEVFLLRGTEGWDEMDAVFDCIFWEMLRETGESFARPIKVVLRFLHLRI
jgi:hypothetical protein